MFYYLVQMLNSTSEILTEDPEIYRNMSAPSMNSQTNEESELELGVSDTTSTAAKVILYNDEWHTFEEVIGQLVKALQCSIDHAEGITWQVHTKGKAIAYSGELSDCLRVSSVLEEIALHTQVEI